MMFLIVLKLNGAPSLNYSFQTKWYSLSQNTVLYIHLVSLSYRPVLFRSKS